jgi:hypothetical protein
MIVMKSYHRGFLYPRTGKERERMRPEQKEPYKVYRAGGRDFPVYLEYDEQLDESYPAYPDFTERPEYTGEGRPFATAEQESCPHCKPGVPGEPLPSDCGGCGWFYREGTPYDIIGICLCDARRRKPESGEKQRK